MAHWRFVAVVLTLVGCGNARLDFGASSTRDGGGLGNATGPTGDGEGLRNASDSTGPGGSTSSSRTHACTDPVQISCDGGCVSLQDDNNNCGGCGYKCPEGHSCEGGVCRLGCFPPTTSCGTASCIDIQRDVAHCGGCDAPACKGPQANGRATCETGKCTIDCDAGFDRCGVDQCYDLKVNTSHCGECGNECPVPETNSKALCANRECKFECDSGYSQCGETCVDRKSDVRHCGTCNNNCQSVPDGTTECNAGVCRTTCNAGFEMCGEQCANVTGSDVNHCGSCNPCPERLYRTASCNAGNCEYGCKANTLNCGSEGPLACGFWDFESATLEGWDFEALDGESWAFSTAEKASGQTSLAVPHHVSGGFELRATPCPNGVDSTQGSVLSFYAYLRPKDGSSLERSWITIYEIPENGSTDVRETEVDIEAGWTKYTTRLPASQVGYATFSINFWIQVPGTIYVDKIQLEPGSF